MNQKKPQILVVDDDPFQHELLEAVLGPAGYEVISSFNGPSAIKMVEEQDFDLMVLDVQMPEMDGLKVLKAVRKSPAGEDLPLILLTALDRDNVRVAALEFGADDYVTKPFNAAEFLARVKSILRRTKRSRKKDGEMVGDLKDVNLGDLMQSMELGSKTAAIFLDDIDAAIHVEDGTVADVRMGHFSGETAFTRIMLRQRGSFRVTFKSLPEDSQGEFLPITPLLMSALAEIDDISAMADSEYPDNPDLIATGDLSGFPPIQAVSDQFPLSIKDLTAIMKGNLKKNFRLIGLAIRRGVIRVESSE